MFKKTLLNAGETVLNKMLSLDPESYRQLKALANKRVQIALRHTDITLVLVLTANGVRLLDSSSTAADLVLSGSPTAFMRLYTQAGLNLYQEGVHIAGDMGFAEALQKILQQLEFDWESGLTPYTGEVAAYYIRQFSRYSLALTRQVCHNLRSELKDYVQEEIQLFPVHEQMQAFTTQVTTLRDGVDRLAARVKLLS